ncbi:ricin-type beta-trefoil lectin domain protein [Streptomyces actinomycinicus]|uniref:Ricin-type beta-trefoil lectin domain protein n=1 Tax=Streptomyces actinomycinicus TaxID=1695166 RepID=A0A937ET50_9ACTN|nr:ricin-type beta-trefoil lectin domain protein [Streptomyces actinomycinicus]MBL1087691.1 ricin-type beta-trefoil lectin domain protein [Streptomyces actinomycinicus]
MELVPWADLSDAALLSMRRAPGEEAPAHPGPAPDATAELRRRHVPAMLGYARLCAVEESARALADEAFEHALSDADAASEVESPWRHRLLLGVHRTALEWAAAGHLDRLAPDFLAWLGTPHLGPDQASCAGLRPEDDVILMAFGRLPDQTRSVLWHAVVEQNTAAQAGRLLDVEPGRVPVLREDALKHYRRAYLETFEERTAKGPCGRFAPLLDLATRPDGARHSCELEEHLAQCLGCFGARGDLVGLNDHPAVTLARGLLPWGCDAPSAPWRRSGTVDAHGEAGVPRAPARTAPSPTPRTWRFPTSLGRAPRAMMLVPAGLLVAVALLVRVLSSPASHHSASDRASAVTPRPVVTSPGAGPPGSGPGGSRHTDTYAELINARSHLCLDVHGPEPVQNGAGLITAACDGSASQKWLHTANGFVRNYADPTYCVDTLGRHQENAGVGKCAFLEKGAEADGQLFELWRGGSLRPRGNPAFPYPDFVLAPSADGPGSPVRLLHFRTGEGQEWLLGATVLADSGPVRG